MGKRIIDCEEALFSSIKESNVVFDLTEMSGKVRRKVWILSYSIEKKLVVLSDSYVKFQDIARLNFKGRNALKFFKEVLPQIPESRSFRAFEGKSFFIYPYGSPPEKWNLVRTCRYFFILHRSVTPKSRKRQRSKLKKTHEYSVVYKLSLSAVKPFFPIRKELLLKGEPVTLHEGGKWREGAREITRFMKQEFRDRGVKELPVVLALKDGREIKGILKKNNIISFYYIISHPHNPKENIFVFKHAVDDFWVEEE